DRRSARLARAHRLSPARGRLPCHARGRGMKSDLPLPGKQREPNVIPGFGITLGFTTFFLCSIVLIPLAALILKAGGMEWDRFIGVITSDRAVASYRLSFGASLVAAAVNMVFGFAIAWTL